MSSLAPAGVLRGLRPLVSRLPALAATFRFLRDRRGLARPLVRTPLGFSFAGHPLMEAGTFEPDEVRTLQHLLPACEVFINVGANIGYYCCLALRHGREVVAFEPVPANLQVLYRNLRANGAEHSVVVHPVAVGDQPGLVDLFGGGTSASLVAGWSGLPSDYKQTVPVTRLDAHVAGLLGRRCLVLIDVEGFELAVLRGGSSLLDADPSPVWVVEINIDEHQPQGGARINPHLQATFDEFEQRGYRCWLVGPVPHEVDYGDVRQVVRTGVNTFSGHNFVFARHDPWARA